jgi:hypothetical protein
MTTALTAFYGVFAVVFLTLGGYTLATGRMPGAARAARLGARPVPMGRSARMHAYQVYRRRNGRRLAEAMSPGLVRWGGAEFVFFGVLEASAGWTQSQGHWWPVGVISGLALLFGLIAGLTFTVQLACRWRATPDTTATAPSPHP